MFWVFVNCSFMAFIDRTNTLSCVLYEGGEFVFIDSERETWNMDPEALRRALESTQMLRV